MKRSIIFIMLAGVMLASCGGNGSKSAGNGKDSPAAEAETPSFDIKIISDNMQEGKRHVTVETCSTVCSSKIDLVLDGDVIEHAEFTDGCPGNTIGVCRLVEGMTAAEAVAKLDGIDCAGKGTSCPDQLARALKTLFY